MRYIFPFLITSIICSQSIHQMEMSKYNSQVQTGLDILINERLDFIKGKKVGLVTNHTGVDRNGKPNYKIFMQLENVHLQAIFAPEHGFFGNISAGQKIDDQHLEDLPTIYSLYGKTRKPTPEMLAGLDVIIYDIQDVGARFYTYISTLGLVMEAAGQAGIPIIVLDRPNPLNGTTIEGPVLDLKYKSFVGMYPIPIRYGLTCGELVQMIAGEKWITAIPELTVIEMEGWRRNMYFDETGLPWIPPSPNIPDLETAVIYPGMCLLEATNVSEGRGTLEPFKKVGAPWYLNEITKDINGMKIPGAKFKEIRFKPKSLKGMAEHPKYLNEKCIGMKTLLTDRTDYNSVKTGVKFLYIAQIMTAWNFSVKPKSMNRIWGNDQLTKLLQGENSLEKVLSVMAIEETSFREKRKPYLLYD